MEEVPEKISVGKIDSSHISKTISIEGRINKIYPIKAKLVQGAFRCQRCEYTTFVQQALSDKLIKPFECDNDVCGRKGPFKLVAEESKWADEQRLKLQDLSEQKRDIMVYIRGKDLIDTIPPENSHIVVTGILKVIDDSGNLFEKVLEASHIKTEAEEPIKIVWKSEGEDELMKIIKELQEEHKSAAPLQDILSKADESGINKEDVLNLIQKMKSAGEIIESANERFRVV